MIKNLEQFYGLNITINTTEDCNLRCKYCYEINKQKKTIPIEYCYKFIDLIIDDPDPTGLLNSKDKELHQQLTNGVCLDFIGGDALMNVDILEKIIPYFIYKIYTSKCNEYFKKNWRLSLSSNGTLFSNKRVRDFCEKYKNVLSLGVSIDGCKEIHDLYRIFNPELKNGKEVGSYDEIMKNWKWYQATFPNDSQNTKATMSKATIPYIYDSLKSMHEDLGIKYINQNFIMENAFLTNDDYIEFDNQLEKCIPYVLEKSDNLYWSVFDERQFARHKLSVGEDWNLKGRCGSGSMPCLGIDGKIYPCFRWAPHSQSSETKDKFVIGDVFNGLYNKKAFLDVSEGAYRCNCTKDIKCTTCEYESACAYCIGGCYSEFGDFKRTTYICEITKIQCKWAKVYWNEYNKLHNKPLMFDEKYQLGKVSKWTPKNLNTNKGD